MTKALSTRNESSTGLSLLDDASETLNQVITNTLTNQFSTMDHPLDKIAAIALPEHPDRKVIRTFTVSQPQTSALDPTEEYYDELFQGLLQEIHFFFGQYLIRMDTKPDETARSFRLRLEVLLDTIAEAAPQLRDRFVSALHGPNAPEKQTALFVLGCLRLLEETSWNISPLLNRFEEQGRKSIDRLLDQTEKALLSPTINTPESNLVSHNE